LSSDHLSAVFNKDAANRRDRKTAGCWQLSNGEADSNGVSAARRKVAGDVWRAAQAPQRVFIPQAEGHLLDLAELKFPEGLSGIAL
jgi:hypothetical protein